MDRREVRADRGRHLVVEDVFEEVFKVVKVRPVGGWMGG